MVRNFNKTRPNKMVVEFSDTTPHNVKELNRTKRRKKCSSDTPGHPLRTRPPGWMRSSAI
jgi:hypothetical protein